MRTNQLHLVTFGLVITLAVVIGYHTTGAPAKPGLDSRQLDIGDLPVELQGGTNIDVTFGDSSGNPFCDGLNLTLDLTDLSISGTQTGCLTGPAYGAINTSLLPQGIGGGVAYSGDFTGLYTQLTFNPPFWIHYSTSGDIVNFGVLLFQPPPNSPGLRSSID